MNETEETLREAAPALPEALPAAETEKSVETAPESSAEPTAESAAERGFRPAFFRTAILLRRGIPLVLAGVAAAVFGISAGSAVLSAGITEERFTRFLLGEAVGGSIRVAALYPPEEPGSSANNKEERLPKLSPLSAEETAPDKPDEPDTMSAAPDEEAKVQPEAEPAGKPEEDCLCLSNETSYRPDMQAILSRPRAIAPLDELSADGEPVILILHTHATEAYADSSNARDTDSEKSVIAVGQRIADRLYEAGIPVIHDGTLFDEPDFTMAYYNASLAIRQALVKYPSLRYILDVHRDSIRDADGIELAVTCETGFGSTARLMLVMGTDEGGADHPDWQDNLALAARLQSVLSAEHPGLMRNINLRSASFNEQYTPGSMLLEVGSCGSTLEEAKRAADLFADALIREIKGE